MDVRDIKTKVPMKVIYGGKVLEEMFSLQKKLLTHYIKIEGLPSYPIDIDLKDNQLVIKDFISRIIEELAEGFESYLKMLELWDYNRQKEETSKEKEDLIPHLQNFNEEIADAWHFLLEILIYCNIDPDDIAKYYDLLLNELNLADVYYFKTNLLGTAKSYGRHCNINKELYNNPEYRAPSVISDKELKDEFLRGGRKISNPLADEHRKQLWDITYHFNLARNMLKNKSWKRTQMMTDQNRFQIQIMEGFLYFIRYMDFIGMTEESIFTVYFKKNLVNKFRIRSQY